MSTLRIEYRTPDGALRVETVPGERRTVFGRKDPWPGMIVLDDCWVARRHACIAVRDGAVILQDLGTDNGTWLDASGRWSAGEVLPPVASQPSPALGRMLARGVETVLIGEPVFWIGRLPCRVREMSPGGE